MGGANQYLVEFEAHVTRGRLCPTLPGLPRTGEWSDPRPRAEPKRTDKIKN